MALTVSLFQSLALLAVTWLLWKLLQRALAKSPLDNIPGPSPESFIQGNYAQIYHRQGWDFHSRLWRDYGPVVKLHVSFGTPCLYIYDPATLHHILTEDQGAVEQSAFVTEFYRLILGPGLMSALGNQHRRQRKLLNPVFSLRNLREMLPVFYETARRLRDAMTMQVGSNAREVDILQWMNRGALELMGQAGLGYSFDPLLSAGSNDLAKAIKALFPAVSELGVLRQLTPWLVKLGPACFRRRVVEVLPSKNVKQVVEIVDTMEKTSQEIVETRKALLEKGDQALAGLDGAGKDVMTCLLRTNTEAAEGDRLRDEEVIAQIGTFVLPATDSTASITTQILHYLAERPEVQAAIRREIVEARNGGDIPFEELMKLPLLDGVVKETLRLNPVATVVSRQALKDIVAPLSSPLRGVDGRLMKEVVIPKGTLIFLGVRASNCNPALWGEDAMEWKPERWMVPLPSAVTDARIPGVYGSLLTFGGGARTCIGYKFAEMEIKTILSTLLESFQLTPTGKDIVWNLATVRFPTVGREGTKPELPLILTPIV
ncbi:cytochrome P450 [Daedalea quercina L-15889]|uniref:Cytochrome P450 n=1 Tax=Daedalea quercina L-15889 TaxID=1314783 RepID=A0A165REV2_9APHY|nr:cytochrome P450 [Daedalea quercina L-15889]